MRHPRTALTMPTRPQDSRLKPNGFDLLYPTTTSRWTIAHPKAERGRDVKKVTTAPGSTFVFGGGFFFFSTLSASPPQGNLRCSTRPTRGYNEFRNPPPKKTEEKKIPHIILRLCPRQPVRTVSPMPQLFTIAANKFPNKAKM